MKLIDKDKVVAEVKKRIKGLKDCHADTVAGYAGEISGLERLLSFLDTIEVKDFELTWEDVAWIVNKTILLCREKSTLTAEDICKDVLKQFRAQKGEKV